MLKIKRRIEITPFRRQRLATTGSTSEPSSQPSTTAVNESLVEEITALVKQLTGDSLGSIRVRQELISEDEDSESEIQ